MYRLWNSIRKNSSLVLIFSFDLTRELIFSCRYNYSIGSLNEGKVSYLHWHSLPVLSLSFSLDGSYLLSGGYECVLVKWLYKKSEPTFRPRLSGSIVHLTTSNDQTFYVTTHSDNCKKRFIFFSKK